jgi:hypothetical protein
MTDRQSVAAALTARGWSRTETATLVGKSRATIVRWLRIPEVRAAASETYPSDVIESALLVGYLAGKNGDNPTQLLQRGPS